VKCRTIAYFLTVFAVLAATAVPAAAWWQFVGYTPDGTRKVYTPYGSKRECERALKRIDAQLTRKYPKLYPRVGSCEEYK
jgi:hypothetical protein